MTLLFVALAIFACLSVSFLYSGAETAVISVNKFKLRSQREQGDAAAGRVLAMLNNTPRLLVLVLVCNSVVNVLVALLFKLFLDRGWPGLGERRALGLVPWSDLLDIIVLTPIVVVFAEILPKTIFRAKADGAVVWLRPVIVFTDFMLRPIVIVIERFTKLVLSPVIAERSRALRDLTRQDVLNLISPDERAEEREEDALAAGENADREATPPPRGPLPSMPAAAPGIGAPPPVEEGTDERRMIQNIIQLQETMARDIMTPLIELVAVSLGRTSLEEFKAIARRNGFSRYPVYPDRIVNLVGTIDLYRVLHEEKEGSKLEDFVELPHFVPETKRVDDLLQDFLRLRIKNAIVVDEYGGCLGWISREDIFEEIVGELGDELDEPHRRIVQGPDGSWLVEGRVEIDAINDALGTDFADDEWDTVAGLALDAMGRIPHEGDSICIDNWRLTVTKMDGRRVAMLKLLPVQSEPEPKAGGPAIPEASPPAAMPQATSNNPPPQ